MCLASRRWMNLCNRWAATASLGLVTTLGCGAASTNQALSDDAGAPALDGGPQSAPDAATDGAAGDATTNGDAASKGDASSNGDAAPNEDAPSNSDASAECTANSPTLGVQCCSDDGGELGFAGCTNGQWSCTQGALCQCGGNPQEFFCSDLCGSDVIVTPTCTGGTWQCSGATPVQSNQCPTGTCWGFGSAAADCCNDDGGAVVYYVCQAGAIVCPQGATKCVCPLGLNGVPTCCDGTTMEGYADCAAGAWACQTPYTMCP